MQEGGDRVPGLCHRGGLVTGPHGQQGVEDGPQYGDGGNEAQGCEGRVIFLQSYKLKNLKLAVQILVLICATIDTGKMLNEGRKDVVGNETKEPIGKEGKRRNNAIRDELKTWTDGSSRD